MSTVQIGPDPDEQGRRRYNVGVTKIPSAQRDVARGVMPDDAAVADRGFLDIIGADAPDEDDQYPVGAPTTYTLLLTDAEVERFRAASNCRYVELDELHQPLTIDIPTAQTMRFMDAGYEQTLPTWHGRDVTVGILDAGTTAAIRTYMGFTLVARKIFGDTPPAGAEIFTGGNHGCLVAPNAVPVGGRLIDAMVTGAPVNGQSSTSASLFSAAATWAVGQGATILNFSYGGGYSRQSVYDDVFTWLWFQGTQVFISAGNDSQPALNCPALYSRYYSNVHSLIAFDEVLNQRAWFSNHTPDASGATPGYNVTSLDPTAVPVLWSGTSAAAPHAAQLCARGCTGGRFPSWLVGLALKLRTRRTGQLQRDEGRGAYDLGLALGALGVYPWPPPTPPVIPPQIMLTSVGMPRYLDGQYADVSTGVNTMLEAVDELGVAAIVRRTAAATLTTGFHAQIAWQLLELDTWGGGLWDPSDPQRCYIQVPGTYQINLQIRFHYHLANGTVNTGAPYNAGMRTCGIMRNGTTVASNAVGTDIKPTSVDGEGVTLGAYARVTCAAGDRIYADIFQNSGGTIECMQTDFCGTYLSLTRIAPLPVA